MKKFLVFLGVFALSLGLFTPANINTAIADEFQPPSGPPSLTPIAVANEDGTTFTGFLPAFPESDQIYNVSTTVSKPGGISALNNGLEMCIWLTDVSDCDSAEPDPQTTFVMTWNWSADADRSAANDRDEFTVVGSNNYSGDASRSDYSASKYDDGEPSATVEFVFQVSNAMRSSADWNIQITAADGTNTTTEATDRLRTKYYGSVTLDRTSQTFRVLQDSSSKVEGVPMGKYSANGESNVTIEASDFEATLQTGKKVLTINPNAAHRLLSMHCSPTSSFDDSTDIEMDTSPQNFSTVGLISTEAPEDLGDHSCKISYQGVTSTPGVTFSNTVAIAVGEASSLQPRSFTASKVSGTEVGLSWQAPAVSDGSATVESYILEIRSDPSSPWQFLEEFTSSTTSYNAVDLSERTTYYFRLTANTTAGVGTVTDDVETDSNAGASIQTLQALNDSLDTYDQNTSVSTIVSEIEKKSLKVFASPRIGAMAEDLSGVTGTINSKGKFSRDLFTASTDLPKLSEFSNSNMNDRPFIGFVGFANGKFLGSGLMGFTNDFDRAVAGKTQLSDLFRDPNTYKNLRTYVLNANGSAVDGTSETNTSWTFSDNARPGANGYYGTSDFSFDDGIWGFAQGHDVNGDSPGGNLDNHQSVAYGIQNYHASDSKFSYYYWGERVYSSNAVFYFFHGAP